MKSLIERLRTARIQPTPQRIAIARHVLDSRTHPTAEEVLKAVRRRHPTISRATVYNTLNLLADRGLVKVQPLWEGVLAFDPLVAPHHHFIDERSGEIHDIPWSALRVTGLAALRAFEIREHHVVLRGRRKA